MFVFFKDMNQIFLLSVFSVGIAIGAYLPKEIPICRYDDVNCLLGSAQKAVGVLYTGDSNLNLGAFDPLEVNHIHFDEGNHGPIDLQLTFTHSVLTGLRNTVIESVSAASNSPKDFKFELRGKLDLLEITGNYDISGQVLLVPLNGKGQYNLTLGGIHFKSIVYGEDKPLVIDGKEHLQLKKMDFKFDINKLSVYLAGLFNGDKVLEETANAFLNNNWRDLLTQVKPELEAALSNILKNRFNKLFENVAFSDAFIL